MTVAAAGAIIVGAVGIGGLAPTVTSTTAAATPAATSPAAAASATPVPTSAAAPSASAATTPPAPTTAAPKVLVAGAVPSSPIQALFAKGGATPADKTLWDIHNPNSPLVLVNKTNPLQPLDFTPPDLVRPAMTAGSGEEPLLRREAATAAGAMAAAAAMQGVNMSVMSSFRSYSTQISLYNSYVTRNGQAEADTFSARPGYSEHQTGFALDIGDASVAASCMFTPCFADSPAAQWVAAHARDYGFIVRYPLGSQGVTGYFAESWHLRYVGVSVAQDMAARGFRTYEEYLGVPAAPGYP